MDKEGLAWCAGFFDGEGWLGTCRGHQIAVNISQTDPQVLEKFKELAGMGRIYGPYVRKSKKWSPCWYYSLYGFEKTQYLVCLMWKWLSIPKREQASTALQAARG